MFEKEAKQYAEDFEKEYHTAYGALLDAFRDGAEFGYNQGKTEANEWHKQDIDDIYDSISKDWSVRYFICVMKDKSRVTAIGSCDEGCNGEVKTKLKTESVWRLKPLYCSRDLRLSVRKT